MICSYIFVSVTHILLTLSDKFEVEFLGVKLSFYFDRHFQVALPVRFKLVDTVVGLGECLLSTLEGATQCTCRPFDFANLVVLVSSQFILSEAVYLFPSQIS